MQGKSLLRTAPALLVLVLAAGCTTIAAGSATPDPVAYQQDTTGPVAASRVLGDLTDYDPCALFDISALPDALEAKTASPDGFDTCHITIADGGGNRADLDVGELEFVAGSAEGAPQNTTSLGRDLNIVRWAPITGYCTTALQFSDGIYLDAVVDDPQDTSSTGSALCTDGTEVLRVVATTLEDHDATHRSLPANSLSAIDPCQLISSATLDSADQTSVTTVEYPGKHECDWRDSNDPNGGQDIWATFSVDAPPTATGTDETSQQIGGRTSVVSQLPLGGRSLCTVETGHIAFGAVSDNRVEVAEVGVDAPGNDMNAACQNAVTVATSLWSRIPAE